MTTKDSKFASKELWELSDLSDEELKAYTDECKAEADRLEAKTAQLRKQAEEDRLATARAEGQLYELRRQNEEQIQRLGWDGIKDEESVWLMDGGLEKYWPQKTAKYFRADLPSLREIREKYQEEMGAAKRDFTELEKKLEHPSGWISRSGKYFAVAFAEHDKFAREFLIEKYGEEKAQELRKTDRSKLPFYEVLERKFKWARIMAWPGIRTEFVLPDDLTHSQKQTLYKYCQFHLKKLPFSDPLFDD